MIKARVLSTNLSAKPDAPIEVNMEMWVFDNGSISCPDEVVIMTEEEYKALDSVRDDLYKSLLDEREKAEKLRGEETSLRIRLNEKEGEICKLIVANEEIQEEIEDLEEKIKQLEEENKALDSVSDGLCQSLLDEREKTKQLEETIKRLKERLAQEVAEVDLCPDGTLVFRKKKVSELEKKVKELEEENKYLKKRLMTRYTVRVDTDGAIIYPELKED